MATRVCRYCEIEKDFSEFVKIKSGKFGISWCCYRCQNRKDKPKYQKKIYPTRNPIMKSKWLSIKSIGINGYRGAAIYKLSFDNGTLFYIGSTVTTYKKTAYWRKIFKERRMNKKMKSMIQDKSCATFEIIEKVFDVSKLFEREEYHIQKNFESPFILNRSRFGSGMMDDSETQRKAVNQYQNGEKTATYPSVLGAAKANGSTLSAVWKSCSGIRKSTVNGFTYQFA